MTAHRIRLRANVFGLALGAALMLGGIVGFFL